MFRLACLAVALALAACSANAVEYDQAAVRQSATIDGTEYVVVGQDLYRVSGQTLIPEFRVYDAAAMGAAYRDTPDGTQVNTDLGWIDIPASYEFDFTGVGSLAELVPDRGDGPFHGLVIRDSSVTSETGYESTTCVVSGECEPNSRVLPNGGEVVFSAASASDIDVVKAAAVNRLIHHVAGDHVWIVGSFWFEDPLPYSIIDLESTWIHNHGGIRVVLSGDSLAVELKWAEKPKWRQSTPVDVPRGQWVEVVWHLVLDQNDGVIELWQDGQLLLSERGPTLPLDDTIYDSLEIGISAHVNDEQTVVRLDSYSISPVPPVRSLGRGFGS